MANNTSHSEILKRKDGYDIPLYGIDNGTFYSIHIPAIICIVSSFTCATIAIVVSFRRKGCKTFFKSWTKSERFVVYLAICDGLFNLAHFTDHSHILIAKAMVRPKALCEFYGFNLSVFITAQYLMVNIVAINAFMLIYFDKNVKFGRYDWRLLLWIFGAPFVGTLIAGCAGQLGPNGTYCYFDGINGTVATFIFTTVLLLTVFVLNSVLYLLTWTRIRSHSYQTKRMLRNASTNASNRAAQSMTLFVAVFFIQWWANSVFGVWSLSDDNIPQALYHFMVTFSNLKGVMNLIVYIIIRRRQLKEVMSSDSIEKEVDKNRDMSEPEETSGSEIKSSKSTKSITTTLNGQNSVDSPRVCA